jgi:RNA polymerase sigma-70 factor (ECF subfamily)
MSGDNISDKELVENILNGNKESYGILAKKYQNMVYRLALYNIRNCDTAKDIAQEAFLIGYENLERLRNPSSFAPWIAGITRNLCITQLRNRKTTHLSLDSLMEDGMEFGDPGTKNEEPNNELSVKLQNIISKLPPKYMEILDLRCAKDFSYQKAADFLGISIGTVRSRIYHAKKEILKRVKREGLL